MDEQRNSQPELEQEAVEETTSPPKTMFDRDASEDAESFAEMQRFARKRAAIWGLAAGGVMSLIIVVCAVLIYLLGTS